jgi:hypothetical protein
MYAIGDSRHIGYGRQAKASSAPRASIPRPKLRVGGAGTIAEAPQLDDGIKIVICREPKSLH